ncbi:hypothetical protein NC99_30390 [Sunxiuqinia dokdonensis]|uniref:Uncharacterized protein n=1 Tax=Sunxiuqinia dokdonensis TaxID=1409788 RepID=A0A0L8V6H9_9BACT|nr:hypothetical protein NC99_30390 [Sunxiuqinia dokdonensis]
MLNSHGSPTAGITFQFQYGAIGGLKPEEIERIASNFNSSMVRLVEMTTKA